MNTKVTTSLLEKENFDTVIVATGAQTFIPNIEGVESGNILDPLLELDGEQNTGDSVVVCGAGLVGCEVAMHLAEQGKKVTMIDMLAEPAMETSITVKWVLNARLAELGIDVRVGHMINKMTCGCVDCSTEDGEYISFEGESVICALGLKPNRILLDELQSAPRNFEIISVGDVNKARKIINAVHEGYHAARRI